jgi:hypothetical protein
MEAGADRLNISRARCGYQRVTTLYLANANMGQRDGKGSAGCFWNAESSACEHFSSLFTDAFRTALDGAGAQPEHGCAGLDEAVCEAAACADDGSCGGELPAQLGNLRALKRLWMQNNRIRGTIPPQMGKLVNLVVLNLDGNQLEGQIPAQIGKLTKLRQLELHANRLSGTLPPEMGKLVKLTRLRLDRNRCLGAGDAASCPEDSAVRPQNARQAAGPTLQKLSKLRTLNLFDTHTEMVEQDGMTRLARFTARCGRCSEPRWERLQQPRLYYDWRQDVGSPDPLTCAGTRDPCYENADCREQVMRGAARLQDGSPVPEDHPVPFWDPDLPRNGTMNWPAGAWCMPIRKRGSAYGVR